MFELLMVFAAVVVLVAILLSYNNVCTMQRVVREYVEENHILKARVSELEFDCRVFDEACDILEDDLVTLADAVDEYFENPSDEAIDALFGVMVYLDDKYSEDSIEDSVEDAVEESIGELLDVKSTEDEYMKHTSCLECNPDCSICKEIEESKPVTVH